MQTKGQHEKSEAATFWLKITMKKMHWAYLIKLILAGKFDVCNGTIVYARSEGITNHLQHNNQAQNSKVKASSIGG